MKKAFYFFILIFFVSGTSVAQWNPDKTINDPLAALPFSQVHQKICEDGAGGFILAYWEDRTLGAYILWVQRIDSLGNNVWNDEEIMIHAGSTGLGDMDLTPDGTGGAIIAFTVGSGHNRNILAQKISGVGALVWNSGSPVAVCNADSAQYNVRIVGQGDGNAIIVWQDERAGVNKDDIYAQKYNASGTPQWTGNGVVVNAALHAQELPEAISDGAGGAIVTWRDFRNGLNYDVYAQHINSAGTRQWVGTDGLLSGRAIGTAAANQNFPKICIDGSGGAIISWQDFRNGGTNSSDIYAQRVNNSGVVQWMDDGVVLCNTTNTQDIRDIVFVGDGAVVVWIDYLAGVGGTSRDIKTQKINTSGNVVWTTNGVMVCGATGDQDQCRISSDNNGGAIFVWTDGRLADEGMDIYAQRISNAGLPLWAANGTLVSNAFIDQYNPYVITYGCKSFFVWTDMRNGLGGEDIYGSSFDCNGNVFTEGDFCDGIDNDNDGLVDEDASFVNWYKDFDNDSYGNPDSVRSACSQPTGYVSNNTDCNDENEMIHPNGIEVCNGLDDDCDGLIDEDVQTVFYRDLDNDGFGNASDTVHRCAAPQGYVSNATDCNDNNINIHPGATETCNGIDDDCDGQVDEGVQTVFFRDLDNDGFGNAADTVHRCSAPTGYVSNNTDCDDSQVSIHPGATELCNGVDDDCDGLIDEDGNVQTVFYRDLDNDGFGNAADTVHRCTAPIGYVSNNTDCDDNQVSIHPGATELCNGVDDDCDGLIDEEVQTVFYRDLDGDGFGSASDTVHRCAAPQGYVSNATDCNDNNINIHPGATETCNGIDDDCDGQVDEGVQTVFFRDLDNDGFGNAADTVHRCSAPLGYVLDNSDCNDNAIGIHPGATEICNGLDDDCDGQVDENVQTVFYRDGDGDGFGNEADTVHRCAAPQGYVSNSLDCDDGDVNAHPDATEACNGIDDNCDGQVDEVCNNTPSISINNVTVSESDGLAVLTVQLSSIAQQEVRVNYSTVDGTATSKGRIKDYKMSKGTLTIPAGDNSGTISVIINTDNIEDDNEFFDVVLSRAVNATINDESGRVTILNSPVAITGIRKGEATVDDLSEFNVKVLPNPSRNHFRFLITSGSNEPIFIIVTDAVGRIIERKDKRDRNGAVILGNHYRQGLYYAEVIQGNKRVVLKLLKMDN